MNFGEVFFDSLSYPFKDLKKFLILFVLFLGSFLLIPLIVGYGYLLRIIEHSLKGEKGLPDFNNWGELFTKGIDYLVVNAVYGIPSLLVTFLLFKKLDFNSISNGLIFSSPVNMLILVLVGFIAGIVFIMALANLVYENRFFAAFDFKRIFHLIGMVGWKKYLFYVAVYTLILNLISLPLLIFLSPHILTFGALYIIFTLINSILSVYKGIFGSRFKGLIYPLKINKN
ncbi:MAG: DUF4013 domain-containing protein [Methanobacterium sp.]|uniref:DUF4013 domain-containing protein n=1 Tax=Methanobacterium sp. TaxID=2164 RepID=UPI003C76FAA2